MVKRGVLGKPYSDADAVSKLLAFFGVGSVQVWHARYEQMNVAYRHSPSFKSARASLAAWLRLGEIEAEQQECIDYNAAQFRRVLREIRGLTQAPVASALHKAQQLCNEAGVALAPVKPFRGTALSGAAWWLNRRKAVIALSARHKMDDHLWFSLFHESAHILLHSKKGIFIDGTQRNGEDADIETEADQWASDFLVPRSLWAQFVAAASYSESSIRQFAEEQGVAPGLVVGRLQHEKYLRLSQSNTLKVRLEWKATA